MKKVASLNRITSFFVLVCFTVATLGSSVVAAEAGDKIVLKKSFWSGYKYQLGFDEKRPVYWFAGTSFKPDFENTLAAYPPALAEAKKGFVFNGVSMVCILGALVLLPFTMQEQEGPFHGLYEFNTGVLVAIAGFFTGGLVFGLKGKSKLKNGVRMYNENAGTMSATTASTGDNSAVSTSVPSNSSASTSRSSNFGFNVGLNMANQDFVLSNKGRTGFAFGCFMTVPVGDNLDIQPEALFSMKGSKWEELGGTLTYKLTYLEFPVLCKYTFPTSGSTKPFAFAGPSLGILMSANGELEVVGAGSVDESIKELYNGTDFGFVFGGGVKLGQNASIDVRYVKGLSNIANSTQLPGVEIKNSTLSFMLGYSL